MLPQRSSVGVNDNLAFVRKYLTQLAAVIAAMCGSAYIIITLSGATRRQALWITGVMLLAILVTAYYEIKGDDE